MNTPSPTAIVPARPAQLAPPDNPGESFLAEGSVERRKRIQRELDAAFSPAQQRAIAVICGQWWESRLEAINVGAVEELRDMVDFLIDANDLERPSAAQIALWKSKRNRTLAGPRG